MTHRTYSLKTVSLTLAMGLPFAVLGVATEHLAERASAGGVASTKAASIAPSRIVEECNQLAAQAPRDRMRELPDRIGDAALGPGEAAGRGILTGAIPGTLAGISDDNRGSNYRVAAYRQCMARRGY
jgi:hypothetical protein